MSYVSRWPWDLADIVRLAEGPPLELTIGTAQ